MHKYTSDSQNRSHVYVQTYKRVIRENILIGRKYNTRGYIATIVPYFTLTLEIQSLYLCGDKI